MNDNIYSLKFYLYKFNPLKYTCFVFINLYELNLFKWVWDRIKIICKNRNIMSKNQIIAKINDNPVILC